MNKVIDFSSYSIGYSIYGDGKPLVFLHGFLENRGMWKTVVDKLETAYAIILIDLPGHGKSTTSNLVEHMSDMANVVKYVCQHENIINPIVFGHSLGGYVALELTKIMSCDVALLHSNFWADSALKKEDRNRVIDVVKKNLSLFVKTAIPNLFYKPNISKCAEVINNMIDEACEMETNAVLAVTIGMRDRACNKEVLQQKQIAILQGENDTVITKSLMLKAMESVAIQPIYIEIANCGHMGFVEKPVEFEDAIRTIIHNFSRLKPNY